MASSSLPNRSLVAALCLLVAFPTSIYAGNVPKSRMMTYHGGPLLTGNVDLILYWYGVFTDNQKFLIKNFIESLNDKGVRKSPTVASWWEVVEKFQTSAFKKNSPPINVKIANEINDCSYGQGKVLTVDFIRPLVQKASGGNPNTISIIFTGKEVSVAGFCRKKCQQHGRMDGKLPYIMVDNPEIECPACAWPFNDSKGQKGVKLNPPNGDIGGDSMVIALAQGLAEMVTNPFNTGFYQGIEFQPTEIAAACVDIFGKQASKGNPGKVLTNPRGGAFNAYGKWDKEYMLPAIWNPVTRSCWTTI